MNYILPSEDLEDVDLLSQNSKSIEDYNFKKTISKYDLQDFIITIIYKNNNKLRVLSKIKLDEKTKIESTVYEAIDFSKENLSPNSKLIIAGKGHENYQLIGNQKIHFDDKEEARKALQR